MDGWTSRCCGSGESIGEKRGDEGGKYQRSTNIKSINFSEHTTNKMLSELYLEEFKNMIEDLMIIEGWKRPIGLLRISRLFYAHFYT